MTDAPYADSLHFQAVADTEQQVQPLQDYNKRKQGSHGSTRRKAGADKRLAGGAELAAKMKANAVASTSSKGTTEEVCLITTSTDI